MISVGRKTMIGWYPSPGRTVTCRLESFIGRSSRGPLNRSSMTSPFRAASQAAPRLENSLSPAAFSLTISTPDRFGGASGNGFGIVGVFAPSFLPSTSGLAASNGDIGNSANGSCENGDGDSRRPSGRTATADVPSPASRALLRGTSCRRVLFRASIFVEPLRPYPSRNASIGDAFLRLAVRRRVLAGDVDQRRRRRVVARGRKTIDQQHDAEQRRHRRHPRQVPCGRTTPIGPAASAKPCSSGSSAASRSGRPAPADPPPTRRNSRSRCRGSLAIIFRITRLNSSGRSGRNCRTSGGWSPWCCNSFCNTVPSGNGGWPASMKNSVQPSE